MCGRQIIWAKDVCLQFLTILTLLILILTLAQTSIAQMVCRISSVNSRLDWATSWYESHSCTDSAVQGNDFEFIPTIRMVRGHSVEGSFSREFSSIYVVRELWPSDVRSRSRCYRKTCVFEKNDPLQEDFENYVPKGFTTSQIHVLCANFVKFGLPEIGKVVCYLPDKKKQNFASLPRFRFCADRAQNLSRPAAINVLRVPQISSKSVHFRRSYSRTREHRSNAPQSVSNTRRSFSFFSHPLSLE